MSNYYFVGLNFGHFRRITNDKKASKKLYMNTSWRLDNIVDILLYDSYSKS